MCDLFLDYISNQFLTILSFVWINRPIRVPFLPAFLKLTCLSTNDLHLLIILCIFFMPVFRFISFPEQATITNKIHW
jgi:hypothetical protein